MNQSLDPDNALSGGGATSEAGRVAHGDLAAHPNLSAPSGLTQADRAAQAERQVSAGTNGHASAETSLQAGQGERPKPPEKIPLMDPSRVWSEWGPQAEQILLEVLRSQVYVKGPNVAGFEDEYAAYTGVDHAVAVDSCTDALFLVLRSVLEGRPAEAREVILPTFTFIATAGAVVNAGGRPVFADVELESQNLDPASVSALLSERTAAVIPVHLFGAPANMAAIRAAIDVFSDVPVGSNGGGLCKPGSVFLLEDAAQSIHATLDGQRTGALADAGTFSFYPSKNLAAVGDAGVVTTNDEPLADHIRALRDHGQTRKLYDHDHIGTNSRMDEIQAALLRLKLPLIGRWTEQRQALAARYDEAFLGSSIRTQAVLPTATSAYHLYTVRVDNRDALKATLDAAGIGCGVYYPQPLHRQTCFARYESKDCPRADQLSAEVLSLPCFPGMREDEQERVIATLLEAVARP